MLELIFINKNKFYFSVNLNEFFIKVISFESISNFNNYFSFNWNFNVSIKVILQKNFTTSNGQKDFRDVENSIKDLLINFYTLDFIFILKLSGKNNICLIQSSK